MLRPNFEEPLDTAKQLVEKNITIYMSPGTQIWKQFLLESPIPEYNKLGETFLTPEYLSDFLNISKHYVIGSGTHAFMGGHLHPYYLALGKKHHPDGNRTNGWYRSKEKLAGKYPYGGYLTNKKWNLNEVKVKDD